MVWLVKVGRQGTKSQNNPTNIGFEMDQFGICWLILLIVTVEKPIFNGITHVLDGKLAIEWMVFGAAL